MPTRANLHPLGNRGLGEVRSHQYLVSSLHRHRISSQTDKLWTEIFWQKLQLVPP